jgi:hypothetical protein
MGRLPDLLDDLRIELRLEYVSGLNALVSNTTRSALME